MLCFQALQEPGSIMSFTPASMFYKKSFHNINLLAWYEAYDQEYKFINIHLRVAEKTISQYRKLSDALQVHQFKGHSHLQQRRQHLLDPHHPLYEQLTMTDISA
jgi:hypothetical protein